MFATLLSATLFLSLGFRVCALSFSIYTKPATRAVHGFSGHVVVANRAAGSVSIINPETLQVVMQYQLPDDGEPMYFGLSPQKSEIWVGDRNNNRLVILKLSGRRIMPDGFLETPEGLFHSMITQVTGEAYPIVWNTCDIANVTVVYDLSTRRKLAEIPLPAEIAALGGVPHDITANTDYGFVTYINNADGAGYIGSYSARTFELIQLKRVARDPHVAIRDSTKLTVAAQGGEVLLLSIPDLRTLGQDRGQPSPHGTIITFNSKYLYVTNIAEMGENAVVTYNTSTLERIKCPTVMSSNAVPHNPATSLDGSRVFITHSGATSDIVSAWDIGDDGCVMAGSEQVVSTGLNPFGLFVLPPSEEQPVCKVRRLRLHW